MTYYAPWGNLAIFGPGQGLRPFTDPVRESGFRTAGPAAPRTSCGADQGSQLPHRIFRTRDYPSYPVTSPYAVSALPAALKALGRRLHVIY
ncbi:hypothetical protein [Klebsiella pneumoniae]|uniref:hypothetical protein n=1 Tax=Klebsiella pneumoniae TaxID=573 RepID=UPI002B0594B4|nr:hypothetical protein [Klebsiella pneumoniae]